MSTTVKIGEVTFPLNEIMRFETPTDTISPEGIFLIRTMLSEHMYHLYEKTWTLPVTFDYTWKTTRGTFPKRVAKYFWDIRQVKLSEETMTALGDLARAHSAESHEYYIDFTQDFDWEAGQFGDGGSCFWGGRREAREMLKVHNAYAMRFYTAYRDGKSFNGIGRSWLVPDEGLFVMFNGYGLQTIEQARTLATISNQSYKRVELNNNDSTSGVLYINGDEKAGGAGYLIAEHSQIAHRKKHKFSWEEIRWARCCHCRNTVTTNIHTNAEGREVCDPCWNNLYDSCTHCGGMHPIKGRSVKICMSCFDKHYYTCRHCSHTIDRSPYPDVFEREEICPNCESNFFYCEGHKHIMWANDRSVTDPKMCASCAIKAQRQKRGLLW